MSTQTQITRLTNARNTIRTKMVALGLGTSTDTLDTLATEINGITDRGAVDAEVKEGETYTILAGYHNGSGTVKGVAGGGSYNLQAKTGIVPTKAQQSVTPDSGYYGLSSVTISAIPDAYQDVSGVTASAGDVLATKNFVTSAGALTAGTMANNGAISRTLDTTTTSTTIPAGYHNGSGTVSITLETKSVSPTTSAQTITPTSGKVLSQVSVGAIQTEVAEVTPTVDEQTITPTSGYYFSEVDVNPATAEEISTVAGMEAKLLPTYAGKTYRYTGSSAQGESDYYVEGDFYKVGPTTMSGTNWIHYYHNTEKKTVTPTTSSQTITPTTGSVLSQVTVRAIPSNYQDTTNSDVVASDVLSGKIAVNTTGQITGTMTNNGAVTATLTGLGTVSGDCSYTIPAGYHNGSGTVSITSDIENALAAI